VPLDVGLQASSSDKAHDPIDVTITLTNLFDAPLILNSRMLVNHPLLPGEVYFQIVGPDGNRLEVQHLATPRPVQEEDFVVLQRGHSIQRTLDLADLYGVKKKGVYRLRVCYHNEINHNIKGQLAWHGSLFSDPIEIQVN